MNARTRIKICGLTREADLAVASQLGPNFRSVLEPSPNYSLREQILAGGAAPADLGAGQAGELLARVQQASEVARQSGVYPGELREMRRRYRLDWSGW